MPEWKEERHLDICEARAILRWPLKARREYLEMIERDRGIKGREKLEEELVQQHRIRGQWM